MSRAGDSCGGFSSGKKSLALVLRLPDGSARGLALH